MRYVIIIASGTAYLLLDAMNNGAYTRAFLAEIARVAAAISAMF